VLALAPCGVFGLKDGCVNGRGPDVFAEHQRPMPRKLPSRWPCARRARVSM
jgi:hypothetical protein